MTRSVTKQAGRLSGMLPDMPHLGVDPIGVVKGMRRAIRSVRSRLALGQSAAIAAAADCGKAADLL